MDTVLVTATDEGQTFDRFSSLDLLNSLLQPSEASFELGDTGTWLSLQKLVSIGALVRVYVNSRSRLTGRIEYTDQPGDASRASQMRFVVRTKLTDAFVSSCDPRISVKGLSVKDFVLACYATIRVTAEQFVFDPETARNLMTGKASRAARPPDGFEEIKEDAAKVRPPETVFQAVDRHLRRHRMMHWDAPDGRICVGRPDDQQDPSGRFIERMTGDTFRNNTLSIQRIADIAQAPTLIGVYGSSAGKEFTRAPVSALEANEIMVDAGFNRPVVLIDEGLKSKSIAEHRARREMAMRARSLDQLQITVDGLSHRLGNGDSANFSPDTVHDVVCDRLGGSIGAWYCEETRMQTGASQAQLTALRMVPRGVWDL